MKRFSPKVTRRPFKAEVGRSGSIGSASPSVGRNAILAALFSIVPLTTMAFQDQKPDSAPVAAAPAPAATVQTVTTQTSPTATGHTPTVKVEFSTAKDKPDAKGKGKPKVASPKHPSPSAPPKPPKPPWQEFKLNPKDKIFLDFTDANPDMILSIFSRTSGITIVKDPSFKASISVTSAKAVGLNEAFEILNTVLELNQYELQKKGHLLVVGKKGPPPAPVVTMMAAPPSTPTPPPVDDTAVLRVYHLKNANATQIARVVNEVFTPQQIDQIIGQLSGQGGNPGMPQMMMRGMPGQQGPKPPKILRASADEYSNAIVVSAPAKTQEEVAKLVLDLDKSVEQPLDSQIFRLKYIGVDEVVDAVQNVLTANAPTGRGGKSQDQNNNNGMFYYGYRNFGGDTHQSGSQTAIAIKQTNSVIVSATKENMEVVRKLIQDLDRESAYVGTTSVIHLENAKADDVATLLNQAFTKRKDSNQGDNPFFYIYSDYPSNQKKSDVATDVTDDGRVVNVRDLTGKVNVIADPNTNSLIVVTLPSNLKLIRNIVDKIDHIAEQVMIETIIVEANLTKDTKLGVEWNFMQGRVFNNSKNTANGGTDFGIGSATTPNQGFSYTLSGSGYKALVNTLQTDARFKVLSTPRIFTSNNVKAEIDVSTQLPYITSTQTGVIGNLTSTYEFKNIGIVLTVTPRVTSAGEVAMDVVQAADDLQGYTTFNAPIINHRQAQTTVSVKDGETIILGGIIRTTTNLNENKIPILGDIPLLGSLFRSTDKSKGQTELMVLLTPHIVHNAADAQKLRMEESKRLSKESQDALGKLIKPPEK